MRSASGAFCAQVGKAAASGKASKAEQKVRRVVFLRWAMAIDFSCIQL
jgi:hypothetical protein